MGKIKLLLDVVEDMEGLGQCPVRLPPPSSEPDSEGRSHTQYSSPSRYGVSRQTTVPLRLAQGPDTQEVTDCDFKW